MVPGWSIAISGLSSVYRLRHLETGATQRGIFQMTKIVTRCELLFREFSACGLESRDKIKAETVMFLLPIRDYKSIGRVYFFYFINYNLNL